MAIAKNKYINLFASKKTEDALVDQVNTNETAVEDAQATADKTVRYSPTLTPASVAANTTAEQTFNTVTGLATTSVVVVNKPTSQAGLGISGVRVSATNTLAITFINATGAPIVPTAAEVYKVIEFKV